TATYNQKYYNLSLHDALPILMRKGSFWLQSDKLSIKSSAQVFSKEEHSYEESELEQTENKKESLEKLNIEEIKPQTFENEEQVSDRKSTRLNSSHVSISYAVF